jgi:hypothetical protein
LKGEEMASWPGICRMQPAARLLLAGPVLVRGSVRVD